MLQHISEPFSPYESAEFVVALARGMTANLPPDMQKALAKEIFRFEHPHPHVFLFFICVFFRSQICSFSRSISPNRRWNNEQPLDINEPLDCYYCTKAGGLRSYKTEILSDLSADHVREGAVVPTRCGEGYIIDIYTT